MPPSNIDKKKTGILVAGSLASIAVILLIIATAIAPPNPEVDQLDRAAVTYIQKKVLPLSTNATSPLKEAEAAAACGESLASARAKASFKIATPTVMPEGYTLKGATASEDRVQLYYSDNEVCGPNAKKLRDGIIALYAGPLNTVDDARNGEEFSAKYLKIYNDSGVNATAFVFPNGMRGVGYPAGVGTSHFIDDGVETRTESYDYPASVWAIDDANKVAYRLEAFIPLEDLIKIAGSLK
ncbi:MAG: hypothetical protein AB1753_11430 [Thermoproteota archaeon]